jgi:GNAT superfamily N-acetyltransferase
VTEGDWLFSYGTLRLPSVQQPLFGREIEGVEDVLTGYALDHVTITDPAVLATSGSDTHPILRRGKETDAVQGQALWVSASELAAVARYEVADYAPIRVGLRSGRQAYVYVSRSEAFDIVDPDADLLHRLLPVARRIFSDTFAANYDAEAFTAFCDAVYGPGGSMSREFASPEVRWKVATANGEPIGYAKLSPLRAPAKDPAAGALELQQIYVLADWHGRGVAQRLMNWAIETARADGAPELYLTVFDHNARAKRFYARHGFAEVGRCTFQLGDRIDDDRIWRRRLR